MRYLKQKRGSNSCTLVAATNIAKWANYKGSIRMFERKFRELVHFVPRQGVVVQNFILAVPKIPGVEIKESKDWPKIEDLENELSQERIVCLIWMQSLCSGHTYIIIGQTPQFFRVVNYHHTKPTVCLRRKNKIKQDLQPGFFITPHHMISISRKDSALSP